MTTKNRKVATFIDDRHLRVGDDDFFCDYQWNGDEPVPSGFLGVQKERFQVERYLTLATKITPRVVVELGIRRGGGSALLHAVYEPELLIGIELASESAADLSSYIAKHHLEEIVKPYYGVDQADRLSVIKIMTNELRGRSIDLVVDDASHLLGPTRQSFEMIFPLVRPGGLYIIEDWNWDHIIADGVAVVIADASHPMHDEAMRTIEEKHAGRAIPLHDPRLVRLGLELVLARAGTHDVIREITVMNNWLVVTRGDDAIDPSSFRLANLAKDHFNNLR
jgi:predicted O-methyltransferase YrrM